jgi:adenylate cyclase
MNGIKDTSASMKNWLQRFAIAIITGFLVAVFVQDTFVHLGIFEKLKLATIDRRFAQRGPLVRDGITLDVVIVGITRESFKIAPEPYPFPREYYARAIRNLNRLGARVIGIDLVFDIPSYQYPENDRIFEDAIREAGNVVLAGTLRGPERRGEASAIIIQEEENFGNIFFHADSSLGFVQMRKDSDGVIRRYPLFMMTQSEQQFLPSLGMAIVNRNDGLRALEQPSASSHHFSVGSREIPRISETTFINFYGPSGTFTEFELIDIIDDETFVTLDEKHYGVDLDIFYDLADTNPFRDKIVLIGSLFPESQDLHASPVYPRGRPDFNEMYGVEIHANAVQTMLDNNYLIYQSHTERVLITMFATFIMFMIVSIIKALRVERQFIVEIVAVLMTILGVLLIFYIGDWYFIHKNLITPIVGPVVGVILGYFGSTIHQYLIERKQKEIIKSIFSHYVSPAIVNELLEDPGKLQLGGERKELTVMFSDIAGFTSLSEGTSPEGLVELLNEYLDAMTEIIIRNRGTLDKYEGDAIMAFWGAPISFDDHALWAAKSALDMQARLKQLRFESPRHHTGTPMSMRIGVNTGEMIVGNMGGKERFDYTVIGDSVNLGARLETANKQYGTGIIISEGTYVKIKERVLVRELDTIVARGRTVTTKIYELVGLGSDGVAPEMLELVRRFNEGIQMYRNRRWDDAIELFSELINTYPDDQPTKLYMERAWVYSKNPPPENWDGVFVMASK